MGGRAGGVGEGGEGVHVCVVNVCVEEELGEVR